MRIRTFLIPLAATAAALAFTASPSHAGERNGNYELTGAVGNAQSICMFSGLEDGDDNDDGVPDEGAAFGPGATPQNWGHVKQFLRDMGVPEDAIAAERPGVTCNGHTGILAGGGGEG